MIGNGTEDATVTVSLPTISSSWSYHSVVFATPADVPATAKLTIKIKTALPNTEDIYIDAIVVTEMYRPLGTYGPYVAAVAGATDWVVGDKATVAITQTNEGLVQRMLDRIHGAFELDLQMPSSGSPVIADSVIA